MTQQIKVNLPQDQETDVVLVLPNGQEITLQYRLEQPSIDVCLPEDLYVTNWQGDDMEPAPAIDDDPERSHERLAKQLCIGLRPTHVDVELEQKAHDVGVLDYVPLAPNLTPERAVEMQKLADRKQHLEYLCYMMLRRLEETIGKTIIMRGLEKYGFSAEERQELRREFYGNREKEEDAGCCEAEGHTITSLLKEWQDTTNSMMQCLTP